MLWWVVLFAWVAPVQAEPTTVAVVNPAIEWSPSAQQLRAIYTMRLRQWPDGQPIRVFVLPDAHPVHGRFAERRLRVLPHLLRRTWDRLVHSGTGQAPLQVANEAAMREAVATTPGAIGYLSSGADHGGVRVINPDSGGSL